jgi:hypothetical protein
VQAMQFASPKGLLNFFIGQNRSIFSQNEGRTNNIWLYILCYMIYVCYSI